MSSHCSLQIFCSNQQTREPLNTRVTYSNLGRNLDYSSTVVNINTRFNRRNKNITQVSQN
uniref:Uncharacterized protein n=1 Tax=Anguilla anguilla TaxID=7936 RepID=A0A0E9X4X4_ANGAN